MLYIVLVLVLAAFGLLIAALTTANTLWAWISVGVSVVAAVLLIMDWLGGRRRATEQENAEPESSPAKRAGGSPPADPAAAEPPLAEPTRSPAEPPPPVGSPAEPGFGGSPGELGFAGASAESGFDGSSAEPEFAGSPGEPGFGGPSAEPGFAGSSPAEPSATASPPAVPALAEDAPTGVLPAEPPPAERPPPADPDPREPDEEPTDAADLLIVAGLSVEVHVVDEHPRYHLTSCTWLTSRPTIPIAVSEARQLGFTPCVRCGPDAVLAAKHRADR